jgi:hypothetical protein
MVYNEKAECWTHKPEYMNFVSDIEGEYSRFYYII